MARRFLPAHDGRAQLAVCARAWSVGPAGGGTDRTSSCVPGGRLGRPGGHAGRRVRGQRRRIGPARAGDSWRAHLPSNGARSMSQADADLRGAPALPWPAWRTGCSARWRTPTTWFRRPTCAGPAVDREAVQSPRAYLLSIVTRLCIDARQSVEARKMTYVGPWLPGTGRRACRGRSWRTARNRRVGVDGVAPCPRKPVAGRAGGVSAAANFRLRLRRDCPGSGAVRAELPADRQPGRAADSRPAPAIRRRPRASRTADRRVPPGVLDRRSERPRANPGE